MCGGRFMSLSSAQRTRSSAARTANERRGRYNRGPENACYLARRRRDAFLDLTAGSAGLVGCNSLLGTRDDMVARASGCLHPGQCDDISTDSDPAASSLDGNNPPPRQRSCVVVLADHDELVGTT